MDLRSPSPYGLVQHGLKKNYPSLDSDQQTDVVIIGAGISGALAAWEMMKAGISCIIVDRRHVGTGSTAASTSLLQYEIDTPLWKLTDLVGKKNATTAYLLCRDSIQQLEDICNELKDPQLLLRRPSFQYASAKKDVESLRKEYSLRLAAGIDLEFLEEADVFSKFGFSKPAGLLSADGAESDAYLTTHALLDYCHKKGMPVFANTEVTEIKYQARGVHLHSSSGHLLRAKKIIIACGYESQKYIPKQIQEIDSTFAIVSEPIAKETVWHRDALIWETATPYLYMRRTNDGRVIVGGKDTEFSNPRLRDKALIAKTVALEESFKKLMPFVPFKTDMSWAGSFGHTKDGLPYIGSIPQRPHTYFALGLGGNGITFSVIASQIIRDSILGKRNPNGKIFAFNR